MVPTLTYLIDIAHLPHQHLGWVLVILVTLGHRNLCVIENRFIDDAHFVSVQLPDKLIVHDAGVDTSLDL